MFKGATLLRGVENVHMPAILIALVLDFILGDPQFRWHPVRLFGNAAARLESFARRMPLPPAWCGAFFLASCVVLLLVPAALLRWIIPHGPFLIALDGVLIYFALGGACLSREVHGVADALDSLGLGEARGRLRMLVSRDTDSMDEADVAAGAIETLAENFSDSACATLFWAALGGPLAAWLHRAVNTLDAMVGYKTQEYREFGFASARLDDLLNYPAARISAAIVALVSPAVCGSRRLTMDCVRSDGPALESPNSGYPIAAFAGALSVRLCGPAYYFGKVKDKPFIGRGARPRTSDLYRALVLYWNAYALASVLALFAAAVRPQ